VNLHCRLNRVSPKNDGDETKLKLKKIQFSRIPPHSKTTSKNPSLKWLVHVASMTSNKKQKCFAVLCCFVPWGPGRGGRIARVLEVLVCTLFIKRCFLLLKLFYNMFICYMLCYVIYVYVCMFLVPKTRGFRPPALLAKWSEASSTDFESDFSESKKSSSPNAYVLTLTIPRF
jgi:hypothetical protein